VSGVYSVWRLTSFFDIRVNKSSIRSDTNFVKPDTLLRTEYLDSGPGARSDTASINQGELSRTACKFDAILRFGQFNTRLWACQREAKYHEEEKNHQQTEYNTDADKVG
jgi:hypothetical protein